MSNTKQDKHTLRDAKRQQRRALSPTQQRAAALAVVDFVQQLPDWPTAERIAVYHASDGEIDPAPIAQLTQSENKQCYLPVVRDNALLFASWLPDTTLAPNRYGIMEPAQYSGLCPAASLDLVLMPLVAWDRQGSRLGMGGGYYDRALSGPYGPLKLGLAHALQEVPAVPREAWDIRLDYVATDRELHRCG
ncbi:MAG: 5-formyltetrahydrofolate cyclo-ligase [Pseudomonadota bacterium]